eukprot:m.236019 g.236019  ORF g.236019 m.236019 type:complete len:57 (+) comp15769_c0_seq11:228-398(+)
MEDQERPLLRAYTSSSVNTIENNAGPGLGLGVTSEYKVERSRWCATSHHLHHTTNS